MLFLRSVIFNILFFGWGFISAILFMPFFIISTPATQMMARPWAAVGLWLAKVICGIRYEVRGQQYIIPRGRDNAVIYASKHQSAWDTMIFHQLSYCPAYVLKRELLWMPLWGWYLWRMKMIAIDRSAKASSMKQLIKQAKSVLAEPRSLVIFPEGTRTMPDAEVTYHPGIVALYSQLKVPVVPVALNSGLYWPRRSFVKQPGKIVIEFLPPIAPGLPKDEFMAKLKDTIETATKKLIAEGRQTLS